MRGASEGTEHKLFGAVLTTCLWPSGIIVILYMHDLAHEISNDMVLMKVNTTKTKW